MKVYHETYIVGQENAAWRIISGTLIRTLACGKCGGETSCQLGGKTCTNIVYFTKLEFISESYRFQHRLRQTEQIGEKAKTEAR